MKQNTALLSLFVFVLVLGACRKETPQVLPTTPPATVADNDHLLLGNPTNAIADVNAPDNYLMYLTYYKEAYSRSRAIPVWVSWHLESSDLGTTPWQDDFRANTKLPAGWYQVQSNSLSGSGFDHGHNCPSADRTSTVEANSSTFLMTNMIPQAPSLNQGPWEGMEDFIRSQVNAGSKAYIIMGNFGKGGNNATEAYAEVVDNGRMTVPANVWKVAVILPKGDHDLARMNRNTTVITVSMPNKQTLYTTTSSGRQEWRNYSISMASLENEAKGEGVQLNLLQNVPDSIRNFLKNKVY